MRDHPLCVLENVLLKTEQERNSRKRELAGLTNALICAHDVLRIFEEAGVPPPQGYRTIHRRLEKRRAYLDPDSTKGFYS